MIIWLIEALLGGVSPVGEFNLSTGIFTGGIITLAGIIKILFSLETPVSRGEMRLGFVLIIVAILFFLGGVVTLLAAILISCGFIIKTLIDAFLLQEE